MRILLIEDDHTIARAIKKGLEQETWAVDVAHDGIVGFDLASSESFEVIILDLMLPGMDGTTLCKKLRSQKIHTPILMLTAKGQVEDRVEGLNSGADDYLPKPFAFVELLARVKALTRRPQRQTETSLSVGDLSLNTQSFEVMRGGKPIILSRKEFALLAYLMQHAGKILTKEAIINHVWEYDSDILQNTVEVYIGYLRQHVDRAFPKKTPLIQTVRGFGYKIEKTKNV
ncbi:DNA-binding response regulator [Candidatus Gottesmanbacteria bacterium RIFCSPHIGHO2_01_FULL_39_10]|uniref:DNA-binding response regulator n=1 Tax=Candidatus Gottesmanbacteria bacterium RIFCSPHIGHO2_01_FULL_39_10 TaxID=1798375 RepID=A0A1F5ZKY7_9BACT|nr:MAG: DNA-binding response regulator [Candidatus Gottesmanbacteria bacterium RIFCSPHIGHO2_01_FULL_39_10]